MENAQGSCCRAYKSNDTELREQRKNNKRVYINVAHSLCFGLSHLLSLVSVYISGTVPAGTSWRLVVQWLVKPSGESPGKTERKLTETDFSKRNRISRHLTIATLPHKNITFARHVTKRKGRRSRRGKSQTAWGHPEK